MSIPAKQATNLKEALNVFDPRAPLQGESLESLLCGTARFAPGRVKGGPAIPQQAGEISLYRPQGER